MVDNTVAFFYPGESSREHPRQMLDSLPIRSREIILTNMRQSVAATNPCVDVLQYSTSFVLCDATHQSAISTSPKKLIIY
jgi:hypothetical protein